MTADLELTVLASARDDAGFVAGFAVTDQVIIALGGIAGDPVVLASSNARQFEPRNTPRGLGLRDVLAVADQIWTCGEYGQLAVSRDHGGTWKLLETGTEVCLFGLALGSDGALWVVGDEGYVARVHGPNLQRVELGTTARLTAAFPVRDEIVALGHDGQLRRWRDGQVKTVACGATRPLTWLTVTNKGTWIVVGDAGFIARSPDGQWYSRVTSSVDVDLESIFTMPDGRLVVVGDQGQILISADDGRTWRKVANELGTSHLWSIERFGRGVLIGGDHGLIVKLAPPGDATWSERHNVFERVSLDVVFESGPGSFITNGLAAYLDVIAKAEAFDEDEDDDDDDEEDEDDENENEDEDDEDDEDDEEDEDDDVSVAADEDEELDEDDDEDDDDDGEIDEEAVAQLSRSGDADDFLDIYGVPLPAEVAKLFAQLADRADASFEELEVDHNLKPDVGEHNLFELMVRRDQHDDDATDLVEAFCGVFCIGSQSAGDTYHLELYEWDGPRQVLHFDHEQKAFSGVVADSLDSLVFLTALLRSSNAGSVSDESLRAGLKALHGKIAPTWQFEIEDRDEDFVNLEAKRRDTEFFFYRSRWIVSLLEGSLDESLFNADFNQVVPPDQLPARYEACEKFIPTALYAMWRAYLFDEPELARYLEISRRHAARLVRDAAKLIDELREGRNELGTIKDVRAHIAAFRALELDPRRAGQREVEADLPAVAEPDEAPVPQWSKHSKQEVIAALDGTPVPQWGDLAWRWLGDGVAHRLLLERLDQTQPAQLAALDELRELGDNERAVALSRLAAELSPEVEALLVGSLMRGDDLTGAPAREDDDDEVDYDADDDFYEDEDDDDDSPPDLNRVAAALGMTERALRLAPEDTDVQFTHAMLLLDGDRGGMAGKADELLSCLPRFAPDVRINIAVRMGSTGHARFASAVDIALGDALPERILVDRTASMGSAVMASYGDVAHELFGELGEAILEHAPTKMPKLVPLLPDELELLSGLAWKCIEAKQRETAITLYDRVLALPIPDEGDDRTNYLRALNNACIQAHAAKAFDAAVRIAERAQPVAHENPYIFHSAACAYAAVGDYMRAFEQVKLAIQHDYDHLDKVEADSDLGPLLEWPEFKTLFRDWHVRQEGN
jgi:photosystem II stability/assembly factor-like uncharacterized protein/tetratricopeptide (TPR) repeat protein